MDSKEKKHLRETLKSLFSEIAKKSDYEEILKEIDDLLTENPTNNQDNEIFLASLKRSVHDTKTSKDRKQREWAILSMAYFLWKYESTYLLCVDTVCRLLIITGHDLFDPVKRQFAESIEEISEVDISTKQKFLERHNFGTVTNSKYQKIRNKIAHHDYFFDENQRLHIGGELVEITTLHSDFLGFASVIFTEICNKVSASSEQLAKT